jgi:hypothetical protein
MAQAGAGNWTFDDVMLSDIIDVVSKSASASFSGG